MKNKESNEKISESLTKDEKFLTKNSFNLSCLLIILSLLIRYLISLYGYSGEGDKPKYGDFEAHRHWFELTNNLNITDWYSNSEINPQSYWPIDYPPVCAYFHFILGKITGLVYPEAIKLKNWGFESAGFKIYMRFTVIFSELLFFYIPLILLINLISFRGENKYTDYFIHVTLILLNPVFILIDHGHFQYNCVMLGLFLYSIYFCFKKHYFLTILFFILSINFKQMGLYYSLVYFFYFLKQISKDAKGLTWTASIFNFLRKIIIYAAFSMGVILIIWFPWRKNFLDVLTRIFPVWRGIFEDKVASFWCFLNIFFKLNNLNKNILIFGSTILTIFFCLPSIFSILSRNSKNITNLGFFNVSISFFMFSFHVHEKTILLPLLPLLLCLKDLSHIIPIFSLVSCFSLFPLLQRENQVFTYYGLIIFFNVLSKYLTEVRNRENRRHLIWKIVEVSNYLFIIIYHVCEMYIPAPNKFPWLYPMLNATFCFLNLMLIYFYSNLTMLLKLRRKNKIKKIKND